MNLTENDKKQIQIKGISIQKIADQIDHLKRGYPFLNIVKPATIGDGVLLLKDEEIDALILKCNKEFIHKKIIKFVPASGAASRMFKLLYDFLAATDKEKALKDRSFNSASFFFANLSHFAFYNDLQQLTTISGAIPDSNEQEEVLNALITEKGLNYGFLPKGLLKFHSYPEGSKTPVQEHLTEGALYASSDGQVFIHFTVSEEHLLLFKKHIEDVLPAMEAMYQLKFNISMSVQKGSTDSIAVDMDNELFRNNDGSLLFRPGGHGALIENLSDLNGDIIFIKNIDNVVPDRLKPETVRYKLALAGLLLQYQEKIFQFLVKLKSDSESNSELLPQMEEFIAKKLCIDFPVAYSHYNLDQKIEYLQKKLNRPLRICGMVKNEGEPGGGPFWAVNQDGSISLQVVESSQIDVNNPEKLALLNQSTHFNPVDLVCGIKDFHGRKFDLLNFIDEETGFISKKSKDGKDLKAIELPGLWNGAMSNWNTIFVEVPLATFNPVKTVNDLLRTEHQ